MNKSTTQLNYLEFSIHNDLLDPLKQSYNNMLAARDGNVDSRYHCKGCKKPFRVDELHKGNCIKCNDRNDNVMK